MVRKREELANEDISDLPPPTHRHPMSGEPIWDQHAVRDLVAKDNTMMNINGGELVIPAWVFKQALRIQDYMERHHYGEDWKLLGIQKRTEK